METGKTPASASTAPPPPPQLLCLSLHETDKIRVMNLAASSIDALRVCIQASWPYGIQSEGVYGISYQFKLRGRPWLGDGEEANAARGLMAGVFGLLLRAGWELKLSTDLSKRTLEMDTFYFKRDASPDPRVQVYAVSFNETDKIRVIGGPPEVAEVVRSCIHNFWHRGLQRERLYYGVPEFKLLGTPWTPSGTETMHSRMFVGQLIEALDRAGWEVYASIDISRGTVHNDGNGHSHYSGDLDSWILRNKMPSQAHKQTTVL